MPTASAFRSGAEQAHHRPPCRRRRRSLDAAAVRGLPGTNLQGGGGGKRETKGDTLDHYVEPIANRIIYFLLSKSPFAKKTHTVLPKTFKKKKKKEGGESGPLVVVVESQ